MSNLVWQNLPNSPYKHGWAFYYLLKKSGDNVQILKQNGKYGPLSIMVDKQRQK